MADPAWLWAYAVAAIALGHVVKGVATVRAELKEATHAD